MKIKKKKKAKSKTGKKTEAKAKKADKKKKKGKKADKKKKSTATPKTKVAEETPKLKKLIKKADDAAQGVEDAKEVFNEALSALVEHMSEEGTQTFKHPKMGLTTIMQRGDTFFWRAKPSRG